MDIRQFSLPLSVCIISIEIINRNLINKSMDKELFENYLRIHITVNTKCN